ncbi:MAG: hypothetical protein ABI554_11880 [Flavobacterium sp.]
MKKIFFSLKMPYYIMVTLLLTCFICCNGNNTENHKRDYNTKNVKEMKVGQTQLLLTYVDSIINLPNSKFNTLGIKSLNKTFYGQLPLLMYDPVKDEDSRQIVIQYYKNRDTIHERHSGVILLIPEYITESLSISDFIIHFGSIKKEKSFLFKTLQPLPVQINVSANTAIKLSFNNNIDQDQAGVILIEIIRFK